MLSFPSFKHVWISDSLNVEAGVSKALSARSLKILRGTTLKVKQCDDKAAINDLKANGGFGFYVVVSNQGGVDLACMRTSVQPCISGIGKPSAIIDHIYTKPSCRGKGIASRLVLLLESLCIAKAWRVKVLAQEEAVGFWLLQGYENSASGAEEELLNPYEDTYLLSKRLATVSLGNVA